MSGQGWYPARRVTVTTELIVKAVLGAVAAGLVATKVDLRRHGSVVLAALAVVSAAAFFNFGAFHTVRYPHHGEMFHYVLGSKYFSELGFDGLYVASLEAEGRKRQPKLVRDLRSYRWVSPSELSEHQREVRGRFSEERWRAFSKDHGYFIENSNPAYVDVMRKDHGYNATPTWTALVRAVNWGEVSRLSILLWTLFDPVLLLVMFIVMGRTFGFVPTAWSVAVFGLAYLSRFFWVGGAFLRHDWLCATVIGVCMLERDKPAWAGLAFGYAAAVRVFPVLFLFAIFVHALSRWRKGDRSSWPLKLGAAFAVTMLALALAGTLAGRGFASWVEFADAIDLHRSFWSRNRVGLFTSMTYVYDTLTRPVSSWGESVGGPSWYAKVDAFRANWWPLRAVVMAALLGAVARAAWVRPRVECAALGAITIFVLTTPTSYYWSILLLIPLVGRRWLTTAVFAVSALLSAVGAATGQSIVYAVAAQVLLVFFLAWLFVRPPETVSEQPAV